MFNLKESLLKAMKELIVGLEPVTEGAGIIKEAKTCGGICSNNCKLRCYTTTKKS